ncbi:MAG: hypothetical protein VX626_01650 [Candidatus Thermoplasmatota archaeon]|nr:hypothetical protein [Candidatus Thermoplasmatota archaeon]
MTNRLIVLSVVFFLLSSVMAAPASAQAADDPRQPSVDNPHMHYWGTSDLASCWSHFDSNDSTGSSETGYGAKTFNSGQQVDVSFNCRSQDNFKENMYLNPNGTILIEVGVKIYSADCDPEQDSNCKDLTLSLYRGNIIVATQVFPAVGNNYEEEQVRWEIPVDNNMTVWNKSQEEPALQVEYSKPGVNDITCIVLDCTGEFWFYYSNNEDGMDVEVNFPIINMTEAVDPDGDEDGGDDDGGLPGGLPGFGILAGLSAMALAVIAPRRGRQTPPQ